MVATLAIRLTQAAHLSGRNIQPLRRFFLADFFVFQQLQHLGFLHFFLAHEFVHFQFVRQCI